MKKIQSKTRIFRGSDFSKNQILTSIKDRASVANLRKTTIYNTNIDLVNDMYTKFGLILSIGSQDIRVKTKF